MRNKVQRLEASVIGRLDSGDHTYEYDIVVISVNQAATVRVWQAADQSSDAFSSAASLLLRRITPDRFRDFSTALLLTPMLSATFAIDSPVP